MTPRHLLRALLLAMFPVAIVAGGCGQDAPTCASICVIEGSCTASPDTNCETSCGTIQAACQGANAEGDFQALVTCIANSNEACNGFDAIPPLCTELATTAHQFCGTPIGLQ